MTIRLLPLHTPRTAITACACICTWAISLAAPLHAKPGDLDKSFGQGGHVITETEDSHGGFTTMALQDDGQIVAAGNSGLRLVLARYTPDGTLDEAFGTGGLVLFIPGAGSARIASIAIDNKRRIICAIGMATATTTHRTLLARYLPDGTPDPSFGNNGRVTLLEKSTRIHASKVFAQRDGKIVIIGSHTSDKPSIAGSRIRVIRCQEDGSPDPGFGNHGTVDGAYLYSDAGTGALLPDGRILVAFPTNERTPQGERTVSVSCYRPDGSVDPGYGSGKETTGISTAASTHIAGFKIAYYHGEEELTRRFRRAGPAGNTTETGPMKPGAIYQIRARITAKGDGKEIPHFAYTIHAWSQTNKSALDRVSIQPRLLK